MILYTSTMVSLALLSVTEINAEITIKEPVDIVEQKIVKETNENKLNEVLTEDQQGLLTFLLAEDNQLSNQLQTAIHEFEAENYGKAHEICIEILESITSEYSVEVIGIVETLQEQTQNETEKIEESNEKTEPTDDLSKEETVEESNKKIQLTTAVSSTEEADTLYNEVFNSELVSDMWTKSQDFKTKYPQDSRVSEVIDLASSKTLEYGIRVYNSGRYDTSLIYFDRIMNEELASNGYRDQSKTYVNNVEIILNNNSAEEYLDRVKNAYFISEIWPIIDEFKVVHAQHPMFSDAVEYASTKTLQYAKKLYNNENLDNALLYFNRVADEPYSSSGIRKTANNFIKEITDRLLIDKVKDAYFISDIWKVIDDFKEKNPNNEGLVEAVDYAATKSIEYAVKVQRQGRQETALMYYNRIINEKLSKADKVTEAIRLREIAESDLVDQAANEYYNRVQDAYFISEIWPIIDEFKVEHPDHSKLYDAVNYAVTKSFEYAVKVHKDGNYENAINYYDRILNEELVSDLIKETVATYKEQALDRESIKSAEDYYQEFLNSNMVSEMWFLSQEFQKLYPTDLRVDSIINHAADKTVEFAVKVHNRGQYKQAIVYYDRIISEELIEETVRQNTVIYKELAQKQQKLFSVKEYVSISTSAYSASERWHLAVQGLGAYPNNPEMISALNAAAERNLELGRRQQLNGNVSNAANYYNRLINEERVKESIRHLAGIFLNQTAENYRPVVYLDPGHGGTDPGAHHSGVSEKILNLHVTNYLKSELESRGYIVLTSRASDTFVELTDRAEDANNLKTDIFISVHHNSMGGSGKSRGIETFIHHRVEGGFGQENNRSKFEMANPRIRESVKLADGIHSQLINETGLYNRGVKGNNYNVLRNTYMPAVLLELGFMDNRNELSLIRTQSYQRKAARAIAVGIDNYFNEIK